MKFFKDLIQQITKEEIENLYNVQNLSCKECADNLGIGVSLFFRLLRHFGISKDVSKHNELIAASKKIKYGDSHYNNREKSIKTCLDKYGVENPFQDLDKIKNSYIKKIGVKHPMLDPNIKEKSISKHNYESILKKGRQTYLSKTGFTNPAKNPEVIKKGILTKIVSGVYDSPGTSKWGNSLKLILINMFGDVKEHYRDSRYARVSGYQFECDFYVPSEDLFIELNGHDTHHNCPFNPNENGHIELREQLKLSTKKWDVNKYNCWCIRDVEKQKIATKNNLNYIVLYPTNTIKNNISFNKPEYSEIITKILTQLQKKI